MVHSFNLVRNLQNYYLLPYLFIISVLYYTIICIQCILLKKYIYLLHALSHAVLICTGSYHDHALQ